MAFFVKTANRRILLYRLVQPSNSMNKRVSMLFTIAAVAVMGIRYSEAHTQTQIAGESVSLHKMLT